MCKFNLVLTNVYATLGTDEKAAKEKIGLSNGESKGFSPPRCALLRTPPYGT
jgi:hypothetical protein